MSDKKYNLLLIKPKQTLNHYSTQIQIARLMGKKTNSIPLALPLIAALTPDNYNIRIVDEDISPIPKNLKPDIVGITMITSNSARGFEIGEMYKKMGVKVVMGGTFPSFHIEECRPFAHSIVVGEAEQNWARVLNDFENNNLQPVYRTTGFADYSTSPVPRWDLIDNRKILSYNVQASRGCPFQCEFCLTTHLFGRKVRRRKVEDVIHEIRQLPMKNILFADENFAIDKKYAKELCRALKPLNRNWMCQSSVDVADDEELLKEMSEAGCNYVIIGFESLKKDSLATSHKYQNDPARYNEIIERLHKHGIHVYASFIVGFDDDTLEDLKVFEEFIDNSSLPVFTLSILGTTCGMEMYDRLEKEGRIVHNLSKKFFVGIYPVMRYKNFDNKTLFDHFIKTTKYLYSYERISARTIRMLENGYFAVEKTTKSISAGMKFRTSFLLLYTHLITRDKAKRRFFKQIFSLIRRKKLAVTEGASVLLMFEAITRHIRKDEVHRQEYYRELEKLELN